MKSCTDTDSHTDEGSMKHLICVRSPLVIFIHLGICVYLVQSVILFYFIVDSMSLLHTAGDCYAG